MIAWLDIETTGLDPNAPGARILEVGVVVTDDELNTLGQMSHVVHAGPRGLPPLDDVVLDMHTANGLISECLTRGETLEAAEHMLERFLHYSSPDEKLPMAGSTVRFDRKWLELFMPRLADAFHYRSIDVSGIKELCRRWCPDLDESLIYQQKLHRSIPDLEDSIALARFYKTHLFDKEPAS